jgi:hypothetical protein
MIIRAFSQLPQAHQGLLYIGVGIVALLYALGFFTKGITVIIVLCSLYAIIKGLMKTGLYEKVLHAMHKK